MFNLSHTIFLMDRSEDARADRMADECTRLYREVGDAQGEARVQWTRVNRLMRTPPPDIRQMMLDMLQRFEEIGDDWYVALAKGTLSWEAFVRGDGEATLRWGLASMHGHRAMGDVASVTIFLRGFAVVFDDLGMREEAVVTISAFEALCQRYGVRPPAFFEELAGFSGRREIDVAPFPDAVARGMAMSLEEMVDYVTRVGQERLAQYT